MSSPEKILKRGLIQCDINQIENAIRNEVNINLPIGGESPIFSAITKCSKELLQLLIDSGGDVNGIIDDDFSNLMWAVQLGRIDIIRVLLENYANPTWKNKNGKTALDYAKNSLFGINQEIIDLLNLYTKIHEEGWSPIYIPYFKSTINDKMILGRPQSILDNLNYLTEETRKRLRNLVLTWRISYERGISDPSLNILIGSLPIELLNLISNFLI